MEKRYQVFISSTYMDLKDERQEIIQALLELDCIPSGMELFQAANDDQWSLIKNVIQDCDYYLVIVGGRYGSIGPSGISYTEMEYRYALELGKPIIGFIHSTPEKITADKIEITHEGREKLDLFKKLIQQKLIRYWDSPSDLGSKVSRSLIKLMKTNPGIGWIRANEVRDEKSALEILDLKRKIEELEMKLTLARTQAPEGTEKLAKENDEFEITFIISDHEDEVHHVYFPLTWNEIFSFLAPTMINESSSDDLKEVIALYFRKQLQNETSQIYPGYNPTTYYQIENRCFDTIIVQLRSLGLIKKSLKSRSIKDTKTYWTLTPYGDEIMIKLRAVKKDN